MIVRNYGEVREALECGEVAVAAGVDVQADVVDELKKRAKEDGADIAGIRVDFKGFPVVNSSYTSLVSKDGINMLSDPYKNWRSEFAADDVPDVDVLHQGVLLFNQATCSGLEFEDYSDGFPSLLTDADLCMQAAELGLKLKYYGSLRAESDANLTPAPPEESRAEFVKKWSGDRTPNFKVKGM